MHNSDNPKRYMISGLIEGCLIYPIYCKAHFHLVTEELFDDDPWIASLQSTQAMTSSEMYDLWCHYRLDPDNKGVPYYFVVRDIITTLTYVIFSDDSQLYSITTPADKVATTKVGIEKGLDPKQLDF